jgi:hypothetical protein
MNKIKAMVLENAVKLCVIKEGYALICLRQFKFILSFQNWPIDQTQ